MNRLALVLLSAVVVLQAGQVEAVTTLPGSNFQVRVAKSTNYTTNDLVKLNRAVSAIELILNSQEFKDDVLNFTYQGQKAFVQNNGMSNEQIYDYIMKGAEQYPNQTAVDSEMDVFLQLYKPKWYQSKRVIGYTDPSYSTIYVNQVYYRNADISDIANNMVHEWLHKMGFGHDFNSTARRSSSVPYAIGYIVGDLIAASGLD